MGLMAQGGNLDAMFRGRIQNAGPRGAIDVSPINRDTYYIPDLF
jgi:hypothetical protein